MADISHILEHLAQAERHVAMAERHVREQQERVVRLVATGEDATRSIELLATFEESLRVHRLGLDTIRMELEIARR